MAKADGYYFGLDGHFYGQEGASTKIKLCTGTENYKTIENGKTLTGKIYKGIIETGIEFEDVIELASIAFAESSYGNNVEIWQEVYALCNAIVNNKVQNEITGSYYNVAKKIKAFVATDGNVQYPKIKNKKSTPEKFNGKFEQKAIAGAINAILYEKTIINKEKIDGLKTNPFDYSYGAIVWDGNDIKTAKYANYGIKFSSSEHNIYNLPDKKICGEELYPEYKNPKYPKRKWDYVYKTTVAYCKKVEIVEKNPKALNNKVELKVKKYKVISGTTFMKETDQFNTVIARPIIQKEKKK